MASVISYLESARYDISYYFDDEMGEHVLVFPAEPPSLRIGVLAGEVAHALRTTLNHVATRYAGTDSDFPIFECPGHPNYVKVQARFPDKFAKIVEYVQPYNRPNPTFPWISPLWIVHRLDILDKHYGVPVAPIRFNAAPHLWDYNVEASGLNNRTNRFENGYRNGSPPPDFKPKLTVQVGVTDGSVPWDGPSTWPVPVESLEKAYNMIRDVIFPAVALLPKSESEADGVISDEL